MFNFNNITKNFKYGEYNIKLETGFIARQSSSSIIASMNDTKVLITVVENDSYSFKNFLPLTVNYYERSYSLGKFPNNFLKREIKQNENEILISRLIDRSIRPLFDKNYFNEIQITIISLSINPDINPDVISIIGTSVALSILDIPFYGPISTSRIAYINNNFILNPLKNKMESSSLDLIISCNNKTITMIESFSKDILDEILIEAIFFGYKNQLNIIDCLNEFIINVKNKIILNINNKYTESNNLYELISNIVYDDVNIIYLIKDKNLRKIKIENIKKILLDKIDDVLSDYSESEILYHFNDIEKNIFRNKILNNMIRIDDRKFDDIREINIIRKFLPRVHGSVLFTRGETQSLVTITLGMMDKNSNDRLLFHYNFLPFSTGEISNIGYPKRREIGHGNLSKRSILPLIPDINIFPYCIRIVSEILESNGSSSMASVCGASLALMDAGIPIKNHVAGIAMGLLKYSDDKYIILTDISGEEDNFGDVDIKISGSYNGIMSLQMDTKINDLNINILKDIIIKSREALIKILNIMNNNISKYDKKLSKFAPVINTINICKSKIKNIIGKGGITIKNIIKETGSNIDINDDGVIKILSPNNKIYLETLNKINNILYIPNIGDLYIGTIIKILDIGLIVNIDDINKKGIIKKNILTNLNKKFIIGQKINVKIINMNNPDYIKLNFN
ncbi:polyribonucleotide nucleotidyltransferase [endosymbiont of Sipalinus gigas]|uniref:polyribonucleotide nucleotidyltransferase n=1 Tax=endosymbiont of Sipalinus gigas TaxID=1972134 RepID=UPI000DC7391A|nr:polyribonucleotide nucleotidyltransferase [endosymbiont of Sipalinus gigas]BBA85380.1 polyribonucleotide nucleotidyltransferase [endosymbiont of Sipalinus gigas]